MEITGERLIPAPRATVWEALNDQTVLQAAIPGCTSLVKDDETHMTAAATVKVGPISARFTGKVELLDLDPPNSYRITGEGQGGIAGFAKGGATIRLIEHAGGTVLDYTAEVQIGGKIAQLGARLIDSTARQLTGVFFDRFVAAIASEPPESMATTAAAATAMAAADSAHTGILAPTQAVGQAPRLPRQAGTPASTVVTPALGIGGRWHGASLLLGIFTGSMITIIATVIGHRL